MPRALVCKLLEPRRAVLRTMRRFKRLYVVDPGNLTFDENLGCRERVVPVPPELLISH